MYTYKLKKLAKNTVEIVVDIPKTTVGQEYEQTFIKLQKNLTIAGFRTGKVPKTIAEKHLKKDLIYQELLKDLVSKIYEEIIKKENLKPVITPKIELIKAKEKDDWQIKISLAEKPIVELGNYKEIIEKIKSEQKKADIWIPGKSGGDKTQAKQDSNKNKQELLNKILGALLKEAKFEISDLIIEEELNRRLTQLVDDVRKLGLSMESYLKSKNLTQDDLRNKYKKEIIDTYKLEFILNDLADKEQIKVEETDLEKLFNSVTDPKEKEAVKKNSYFYASILRKQKTLDYLIGM